MNKIEYNKIIKKNNHNKKEIKSLGYAGCYQCITWFSVTQIKEWVDNDETALCPHCRLDTVLPIKLEDHESMLCTFKEIKKFEEANN